MSTRTCSSCQRNLADGQRFCGHCGADKGPIPKTQPAGSLTATRFPPSAENVALTEEGSGNAGRFSAGTVIAGRYRIVGLLGRGGMGEVYRADDLKLACPVALKFLPGHVERDPARLHRLLNEVRTALSVSHPNVCRVHDIHQEAGRHFITMEFVDGDDLSILLRRIGRLPSDKALDIARQLCAGLNAAHAAGILHRDLKPANIMIDGRGQVKITDFGLAGLAGGFEGSELRAGTPAYMAPEQLAGEKVSVASDLYSLGLVLYEIYTGKPAFEGTTAAEIARRHTSDPTSLTSHVSEIDPAVERIVLRCLARDPEERPGSTMAVSAALPGGDPLAAALAAGETPSPELVAEAGAVGGLKPVWAWTLLAVFVAFLGANIAGSERFGFVSQAKLPKSGEVLEEKAREILLSLGFDEPHRDSIYSFEFNQDYVHHLQAMPRESNPLQKIGQVQPSVITFGYRQSPDWLNYENGASAGDWIDRTFPLLPGAVRLRLDPIGRLLWFDAVPPELDTGEGTEEPPEWSALLEAAGLEEQNLTEVEPRWLPIRGFDRRRAWEGVYPDAPQVKIRIEAAAYKGRPVTFKIVEPWARPSESALPKKLETGLWGAVLMPLLSILTIAATAGFAWRNLHLGRGDRRTAVRFGLTFAVIRMGWYVVGHHVASGLEIFNFTAHLSWSLYRFGLAYIFYLALEPYARKLWPRMLTSWVRLFDGRFRDPLVGRDVLMGLLLAAALPVLGWLHLAFKGRSSNVLPSMVVDDPVVETLHGFSGAPLGWLMLASSIMFGLFVLVTIIFVCRLLFRKDWLAMIPLLLIFMSWSATDGLTVWNVVQSVFFATMIWVALFRFGLLTLGVMMIAMEPLKNLPLTFDLTAWWAVSTWVTVVPLLVLALWSFHAALAGRPVFRDRLFEN